MVNKIQIKRGTSCSTALSEGELGFNLTTNTLYIGKEEDKLAIGGPGAFIKRDGDTMTGLLTGTRAHFTSTTDVLETSNANVALRLGSDTGIHIDIDNNEIIAKTDAATMGTLYLQGASLTEGGVITKGTWNATAIGVPYGGTGGTTAETARNNLQVPLYQRYSQNLKFGSGSGSAWFTYYDDDGNTLNQMDLGTNNTTFSKPVNIASGGTGASSAASAREALGITPENINAVKKSGDTMTGTLVTPYLTINKTSWPSMAFKDDDGNTRAGISITDENRMELGQRETGSDYQEWYMLPTVATGLTASKWYYILTSKNPVTIAQGGTGGTNLSEAQQNIIKPQTITDTSFDVLTLPNGYYHTEIAVSQTANNFPYDSTGTKAEIVVYGNRNGNNGYYFVCVTEMWGGTTYINRRMWSSWSGWYKLLDSQNAITIANGGTGQTTARGAEYAICNNMLQATSSVADDEMIVVKRSSASASTTNGALCYKNASLFKTYIQNSMIVYSSSTPSSSHNVTGKIWLKPV